MEKKLPIYSSNETVKKERKQNYLNQLQKSYPNLKKLTEEQYFNIKRKLEQEKDKEVLNILMEKSLYHLIEAVADMYARYDIEDVLPIEDGLSCFIFEFNEKLKKFETLPECIASYTHSAICYYAYLLIAREYNNELLRFEKLDLMAPKELEYKIDQTEFEEISEYGIHKEDFAKALKKASKKLSIREKDILTMRLGLITGEEMSLKEIADIYEITRGRVNEIFVKTLRKLREERSAKLLRDYNNVDMGL